MADNPLMGQDGGRERPGGPLHLHLLEPRADHYRDADVVLAASCVLHAANADADWSFGKGVTATACPKGEDIGPVYAETLRTWCDVTRIRSLTLLIMDVPCCDAFVPFLLGVLATVKRKVPTRLVEVDLKGQVKREQWLVG